MGEIFETADGSTLDIDCTQSYNEESSKKTGEMINEILSAIAASGCSTIMNVVTHSHSFIAMENQVSPAFHCSSYSLKFIGENICLVDIVQ